MKLARHVATVDESGAGSVDRGLGGCLTQDSGRSRVGDHKSSRFSVPHPPEDFPHAIGFPVAPGTVAKGLEGLFALTCLIFAPVFA